MRRLFAGVAKRLGLRPRPHDETDEPPTVRAPRQADPARAGRSTAADSARPPVPGADQAVRSRPPAPRQRARVVTRPPARGRRLVYAPELDGRADPGEIVWAWVPYEDDPRRGKDRPVLV